ncbi:MAG TPA: SDR family NAD(P)-dependent oxidoreductase [Microbacteriaceae bacterium]|nr:SDR family NAD(P)-dependent oxidoreductase [Microbacteriaceae bacterium]
MTSIGGKVAVVTGGASGIGRGIAEALLERGASVVIADIEQTALDATVEQLRAGSGGGSLSEGAARVEGCLVDVSKSDSVQALGDFVLERFGRVDIVCLNAGVGPSGLIKDLTLADWEWILGVNLWGVIHGVTTFLPLLEANPDGGHIEITGSNAGFIAQPTIGSYSVTKFGVLGLAEVLADELAASGSKVRVTYLAPGMVRTNIGTSARNRPAGLEGALHDADISKVINQDVRWINPITVGRIVARAIEHDDLYAPTHPDIVGPIRERHARIIAAHEKYPIMEDE